MSKRKADGADGAAATHDSAKRNMPDDPEVGELVYVFTTAHMKQRQKGRMGLPPAEVMEIKGKMCRVEITSKIMDNIYRTANIPVNPCIATKRNPEGVKSLWIEGKYLDFAGPGSCVFHDGYHFGPDAKPHPIRRA